MSRRRGTAIPINKEYIPGYYLKRAAGMTDEEIVRKHEDGLLTAGTSIFDPVLCELAYRWFCPPGGLTLDPFAGGSVRGIVAAWLGRRYVGVDLRPEQVEANMVQAVRIFAKQDGLANVSISTKWAQHQFSCTPDYIVNHCKGRCCEGTGKVVLSLLPDEAIRHKADGFEIKDGFLQPDQVTGKCPHKLSSGLCGVHGTDLQPFGCVASPFTLNKNNTLIVRHRYSLLKCHGQGAPAYEVFRASLDLIFGESEAGRICALLDSGQDKISASMPRQSFDDLHYLDRLKQGDKIDNSELPRWIVGDSRNLSELVTDRADFIFSCPPYYDLEVYCDDERDLSTLGTYDEFVADYRGIVAQAVELLNDDCFACFVVGDMRDKKGIYRNFVSDTIAAFQDAGAMLYNEAILVTAVGSLPIRVGRQFEAGRKLGKTHQNVLVFVKGDWRKATEAVGPVQAGDFVPG